MATNQTENGRGLLKEHFYGRFVKMRLMPIFIFFHYYKNTKVSSFKSNEHICKKVDGHTSKFRIKKPYKWPCNDFAVKARGKHAAIL